MVDRLDTSERARVVGRFAPSPTGRMHAGNIFAALMSWLVVKSYGGRIVLRIEDLDVERSRSSYADQIMRDFEALGLAWDEGPYYQQGRNDVYGDAFERLSALHLTYPCFCTRADLKAASAPHRGEKAVYPGLCRGLTEAERAQRAKERRPAWRLRVPDVVYGLEDLVQGHYEQNLSTECGDFVVRRSDGLFAYQLASVVDDAEQGVNMIVRGVDLLCSTPQQEYLQDALGLGHCRYAHVPLLVGEKDRRLSKRDKDASLDMMLQSYGSPAGVIGRIAYVAGLRESFEPTTPEELLAEFDVGTLERMFPDNVQVLWRQTD